MLTVLLFAAMSPAAPASPSVPPNCLNLGSGDDLRDVEVTLEGRLTGHIFPGPPNYEDVRHGDAAEPAYILELRTPVCLYDGGVTHSETAHLYTSHDALWAQLRSGRGHFVRVHGQGFGEITGHHRAPLVVDVDTLTIERR